MAAGLHSLVFGLRKQRKTKAPAVGAVTINGASPPSGLEQILRERLDAAQQGHIFDEWSRLSADERQHLLADLQARHLRSQVICCP